MGEPVKASGWSPQGRAIQAIQEERRAQDAKWGEQNHEPEWWLAILMEKVGELAQAVLDRRFAGAAGAHVLMEAVQVAAVGLAIVECCERNGWHHPPDEGASDEYTGNRHNVV